MRPLLIFGLDDQCARVVGEIERAGIHEIAGFVACKGETSAQFLGRPVFSPESAVSQFSKKGVEAFAAGGNAFLNQERFGNYVMAKRAGFRIASVISVAARIAEGVRVRENSFIDADVRILGGAQLRENVWIMQSALIGSDVGVGRSAWVGERALIEGGAVIERNCTLAPGAIVRSGTTLKNWSVINSPMAIDKTPETPIFVDPLFRCRIVLRSGSSNP